MIMRWLVVIGVLVVALQGAAQTGNVSSIKIVSQKKIETTVDHSVSISGYIMDGKEAIYGIFWVSGDSIIGYETNNEGFFELKLKPGKHEIGAQSTGYAPTSRKMNLKKNQKVELLIQLKATIIE